MRTALYTSGLCFLSFDFFFTNPIYSLHVEDDGDIATLVFFLIVAGLSSRLAARMQEEMAENRFMVQRLTNINNFSRLLATAPDSETILQGLAEHIAKTFSSPTWVILEDPGATIYGHDGNQPRPPLAQHMLEKLQQDTGEGAVEGGYHLHFNSPHGINGQVYLQSTNFDAAGHELVRILCDLAAVTLERARLVSDLEHARVVSESEQLRSALLSSVSHDLRTPLSTIIGSSSSLLEFGNNIQEPDRTELLQTVLDEAERLNRYIQNLLDMTRLGGGNLKPRRDWADLGDIISTALERLHKELSPYKVDLQVPDSVRLLYIQSVLIEQALVNVLDNARRFSPDDGTISIAVQDDGEAVTIDVCDQGPGIPEDERERVFDMFYTATRGDRHGQGTGLGLAICRGLLNAHGGQVTAHSGKDGKGTCIRLYLPHHEPE
jgi:two-component system sensor histidine kinase KdpD